MLEQIENALYAEDPKFASNVRSRRFGGSTARRRLQAIALFLVGLVLLIGGVVVEVRVGGFPIISLIGFLVMFGAGLLALWGSRSGPTPGRGASSGPAPRSGAPGREQRGRKFSERMEERFNRRFEEE
jgi:protein-S-isoprenylcysteine O-methyltransferase Ste14